MKKQKSNDGIVFVYIVLCIFLLLSYVALLVVIRNDIFFIGIPIFLICLASGLLIYTRYSQVKINRLEALQKEENKATCIVEKYIKKFSFTPRRPYDYYLIISYKGESGNTHQLMIQVEPMCLNTVKIGTKLECYINGEDCFVPWEAFKDHMNESENE